MVEPPIAARSAPAHPAAELARLRGRLPTGAAVNLAAARRPGRPTVAEALHGKAYSARAALAAKLAPQAKTDPWKEF